MPVAAPAATRGPCNTSSASSAADTTSLRSQLLPGLLSHVGSLQLPPLSPRRKPWLHSGLFSHTPDRLAASIAPSFEKLLARSRRLASRASPRARVISSHARASQPVPLPTGPPHLFLSLQPAHAPHSSRAQPGHAPHRALPLRRGCSSVPPADVGSGDPAPAWLGSEGEAASAAAGFGRGWAGGKCAAAGVGRAVGDGVWGRWGWGSRWQCRTNAMMLAIGGSSGRLPLGGWTGRGLPAAAAGAAEEATGVGATEEADVVRAADRATDVAAAQAPAPFGAAGANCVLCLGLAAAGDRFEVTRLPRETPAADSAAVGRGGGA